MLEEEEFENYALPLNVAIVTIADFIASEEDMTEDDRKTAAIVLYMIAQKLENSGDSEIEQIGRASCRERVSAEV